MIRIINLMEDTKGQTECLSEHGLSFYVETERHRLLMDTGATSLFLENAEKLGLDLKKVDTVVISHGHYDHGGGLLSFAEINPDAKIYVQEAAFDGYYTIYPGKGPNFVGLSPEIRQLPQTVPLRGDCRIDEELTIFSDIGCGKNLPSGNRYLKRKQGEEYIQDDFSHEQCLVVKHAGKSIVFSGCAHHGILNVMERYRELYGKDPDVLISGFHMVNQGGYTDRDLRDIADTARELQKSSTVFYTGHCTGLKAYEILKEIMGDQLHYIHCGDAVQGI